MEVLETLVGEIYSHLHYPWCSLDSPRQELPGKNLDRQPVPAYPRGPPKRRSCKDLVFFKLLSLPHRRHGLASLHIYWNHSSKHQALYILFRFCLIFVMNCQLLKCIQLQWLSNWKWLRNFNSLSYSLNSVELNFLNASSQFMYSQCFLSR